MPQKNIQMTNKQTVNILKDVTRFKRRFFDKYGIDVHLFFQQDNTRLSLNAIEGFCLQTLHEVYPEYKYIDSLSVRTRFRPVTMMRQIYFYLAITKYGYRKSETAVFIKRNHATAIHSIKVCEDYLYVGYHEFELCLSTANQKIITYVGTLSENNTGEDNTKSDADALQHEGKDISSFIEL